MSRRGSGDLVLDKGLPTINEDSQGDIAQMNEMASGSPIKRQDSRESNSGLIGIATGHVMTREERVSEMIEDYPVLVGLGGKDFATPEGKRQQRAFNIIFQSISIGLLVVEVLLAIFVDNFDVWISWVAGIAANSIGFILPALYYVVSTPNRNQLWWRLGVVSLVIGIFSMMLNIFSNIYAIF